MPAVLLPLDDINRTVLERMYFSLVEYVISQLNMPEDHLTVLYKDHELARTDNGVNVTLANPVNRPLTVSKRGFFVKINEDYNEDYISSTLTTQHGSYPIFMDTDIDVSVYPVYVKSNIEFEFKYSTASRSELMRVRDLIRMKLSQLRNILIHSVDYTLIIPTVVEDFIADIYDLKSRLVDQSLKEYFLSHTTKHLEYISDLANSESMRLGVFERQVRIVGEFDFILPDKPDTNLDDNAYDLNFTYKLLMDIPRGIVLRYPVMVANRVVPLKYIQSNIDNKVNSKEEIYHNLNYLSYQDYALSYFETHRFLENRINIKLPVNIPFFDDFVQRVGHKGYVINTSILVEVDESDRRTLINLKELGDYELNPLFIEFLKTPYGTMICTPYKTPFYIGLHQGTKYFDAPILEIDSELTIRSKIELSLMQPIRITIDILIDPSYLNDINYKGLMKDYPDLYLFILHEILYGYIQYKTESYGFNVKDTNFFRFLIDSLYYAYLNENFLLMCGILKEISSDEYIFKSLIQILISNYPTLTQTIKQYCTDEYIQSAIYEAENNSSNYREYIKTERPGVMKTHMVFFVEAMRQEV